MTTSRLPFHLHSTVILITGMLLAMPATNATTTYSFQTLNDNADPTFNQLLGINNTGEIAGYFGSGSNAHPNKGYTLMPVYTQGSYTNENFPGSFQTQVTGLNNGSNPVTVGFWADTAGDNFGFVKNGPGFTQVVDPNTPAAAPGATTMNQILGVNNSNIAVGFYVGADGNTHGYTYNIGSGTFSQIDATNATSTTATGINNNGVISGFYTDTMGNQHGFIDNGGTFSTIDDPNGTNTTLLGINNAGQAVGTFVDGAGMTNGFVYTLSSHLFQTVDDPLQSATAAFNVTGTTINGLNDLGQVVGFYSDGTNVDGFLATPVPEPRSLLLFSLGAGLVIAGWKRQNIS